MATTTSYPHIEKPEGQPARLLKWPRVRVAQIVMDQMAHAWNAEEICRQYPHLAPAAVHSAFAYYYDNKDEVNAEIDAELAELRAAGDRPRSSIYLRLKAEGRM